MWKTIMDSKNWTDEEEHYFWQVVIPKSIYAVPPLAGGIKEAGMAALMNSRFCNRSFLKDSICKCNQSPCPNLQ